LPAKHRAPRAVSRLRSTVVATTTGPLALAALGTVVAPAAHAAPSAGSVNWDAIAQCESSGNWAADTGNGFFGGLQFTQSTWKAFGGSGTPQHASREQQIAVAEKVLDGQGIGAWPVCGKHGGSAKRTSSSAESTGSSGSTSRHAASAQQPATTRHRSSTGSGTPKHAATGDYTVAQGDTLGSIASTHAVEGGWKALTDANPDIASHPDLIMPGQQLTLPGAG
jgi:resuscitation-promoting factor RpfA